MNKYRLFLFGILLLILGPETFPQDKAFLTPLEKNGFSEATSHDALLQYVALLGEKFDNVEVRQIGTSVQGRAIPMVHVSNRNKKVKLRVFIICQQHGNEPSGKEAALILLRDFASGKKLSILSNLDLYIIPSANPDGNEAGKRDNANGKDMNRDHLALSQPEVLAIHNAFNSIHPDVTLDVHEYTAFRKEFRTAGFVRTTDEEFGAPTNLNISETMRNYAADKLFPYLRAELAKQSITFSNYFKIDSPDDTVRASTTAINDGRQSFGILGNFSFILEGRNGRKMNDALKRRVRGQEAAIEEFLTFVNANSTEITSLVAKEKSRMAESAGTIDLQMNYVYDGAKIDIPVTYLDSNKDTIVQMPFASGLKVSNSVSRPKAYYIPAGLTEVIAWLDLHKISYIKTTKPHIFRAEVYGIKHKSSVWMENKNFSIPELQTKETEVTSIPGDIIVPLNQSSGVMLVIALEPASMWGIVHQSEFKPLCKAGNDYPIFRITEFKGSLDEHE
jgi:hypothetical protein